MERKNLLNAAGAILLALGLNACSSFSTDSRPEAVATYVSLPIRMDGKLEEPAWYKTPAYSLVHAEMQFKNSAPDVQKFFRNGVVEAGKVRLLWNDKYLYAGFEFTDLDIVAEGQTDQLQHYRLGDVAELFLKPENKSWYWELYVTPRGHKSAFFFPGRGLLGLPSGYPEKPVLKGMIAAASFKGSLNNSWDKDKKWTAEIAIPLSELAMAGEKLDQNTPWLIFFGRYNYGRYLATFETSSFPRQKTVNYHEQYHYARLRLVKGAN